MGLRLSPRELLRRYLTEANAPIEGRIPGDVSEGRQREGGVTRTPSPRLDRFDKGAADALATVRRKHVHLLEVRLSANEIYEGKADDPSAVSAGDPKAAVALGRGKSWSGVCSWST